MPTSCIHVYIRFLLSLLLLALHAAIVAQSNPDLTCEVKAYGVEDGLISRRVDHVVVDRQGFVWIATPRGVQRFDGYSFLSYTMADGLSTNAISSIWPDADGLLWLVSQSRYTEHIAAIDILNPVTGELVSYVEYFGEHAPAPLEDLMDRAILLQDSTLLLAAKGRLIHYHSAKKGSTVVPLTTEQLLRPFVVTGKGEVWCTGITSDPDHQDLIKLSPAGEVIDLNHSPMRFAISTSVLNCDLRGRDGMYFFVAEEEGQEPFEYGISSLGKITRFPDAYEHEKAFRHSGAFHLNLGRGRWIVEGTIRQVQPGSTPLMSRTVSDPMKEHPEVKQTLYSSVVDERDNIWLASEFGLWHLTIRPNAFQRLLQHTDSLSGQGSSMRGLAVLNDTLYANVEQRGFCKMPLNNSNQWSIKEDKKKLHHIVKEDEQGGLWVSDNYELHHWYNGAEVAAVPTSEIVVCLLPMGDKRMLLGTISGLAWTDTSLSYFESHAAREKSMIASSIIQHLFKDSDGKLWACSSMGLCELDEQGSIRTTWSSRDSAHYLPANDFHHMYEDSQGIFWLSTATSGLVRWDRSAGTIRTFTTTDGWPSNAVYAVYSDEYGKFWLPTGNGIVRFDPKTEQVYSYSTVDGISHYEFNRWSHTKGPDGRFYFGSLNGVTAFHPDDLTDQRSVEAPLVISRVQQFDGNIGRLVDKTAQTRKNNTITVMPEDRYFVLNMALLSFEDPSQLMYNWRVDGLHTDWNYQREPELSFASLPYGQQKLRIRAKGGNGAWSRDELVIFLNVIRPWYLRWWAITLFIAAIAGGVYMLFRIRLARVRAMMAMRDRIALDLHDEVGSTLSSVALFSTAISNTKKDRSPEELDMLERIAANSAQAMESMNDIVWSVNTRYAKLADVEDRMNAYAGPLADAQEWQLDIMVEERIRHIRLAMNERKNLYLIFKEAINNAAKYAQCDRVQVTLEKKEGKLQLAISDNGIGLGELQKGNEGLGGNGLRSMQLRAAAIGGELHISDNSTPGTSITLTFKPERE